MAFIPPPNDQVLLICRKDSPRSAIFTWLQKKEQLQSIKAKADDNPQKYFQKQIGCLLNIIQMSKAFKKKKQSQSDLNSSKIDFLLGSQLINSGSSEPTKLERSLIIKCAMFWDTKSRVERIKSLVLSNMNLDVFQDVDDFSIDELTSIELLSLSKNRIIHLQPISVLDTLITLNINHNRVYNLAPLEEIVSLEELYASNNQISNIDPLKTLQNLRVLNLYKNKISVFESAYKTLQKLGKLDDLDVQQNPFYDQQARKMLILLPISRLNDKMVSKAEKSQHSPMSNTSISMSSSCIINPLSLSMMRDTGTSFFNPSSKSLKGNKIKELKQKLEELQDEYSKIDDQFQEEIVKNVMLKSEYHKKLLKIKEKENAKEQNQYKAQEIKLMKRKAKDLKDTLFKHQTKGKLLRQLFELQLQGIPKKSEKKEIKKEAVWVRKFDCDDVIIIDNDYKYFQEDKQLAQLLDSNSNTLEELRRQLQYLS